MTGEVSHSRVEPNSTKIQTDHQKYLENKKKFQNLRLGTMLQPKKNNSKLQKYLQEKNGGLIEGGHSTYESASFAETGQSTTDFEDGKRYDI